MSKILQTENPKIVTFYDQHPSINFEKANLLLIEFLDSMFNHISTDPDANINSQILSYISSSEKDMQLLKSSIQNISDTVSKISSDTIESLLQNLGQIKTQYVEEVKSIVSNGNITAGDKIASNMEKNNMQLLDKTTILLNEVIPKTQNVYQTQLKYTIESNIKSLHNNLCNETSKIVKSSSNEQQIHSFLKDFDTKYSAMLQSIQQPLFSYVSASEERLSKNMDGIKEISTIAHSSQASVQEELKTFLSKYSASSNKGKYAENNLYAVLTDLYPSAEIQNTTGVKASGDFMLKRIDKPNIMLENKDYSRNIDKDEVSKFIRDIDTQNTNGIFISQYSGITFKNNYHIDVHKGNILVYIQHCEYNPDRIRIAVDIIDYLATKVQELNVGESNNISKEILDSINDEYQGFISQRDLMLTSLKDFQKKMATQIDALKLPSLDRYLDTKYAYVKERNFECDLCHAFIGSSKQSLSAHKRGCKKKHHAPISAPLENDLIVAAS